MDEARTTQTGILSVCHFMVIYIRADKLHFTGAQTLRGMKWHNLDLVYIASDGSMQK